MEPHQIRYDRLKRVPCNAAQSQEPAGCGRFRKIPEMRRIERFACPERLGARQSPLRRLLAGVRRYASLYVVQESGGVLRDVADGSQGSLGVVANLAFRVSCEANCVVYGAYIRSARFDVL